MPVMSYALCPDLKKCLLFAIGEGSRFVVICFLYASGQMFFLQTPRRRPPHITGLRANSVTLGWVGAPNDRAPFRFHDAIADFSDRCLTSTQIADRRPGVGGGFMNIEARAIKLAPRAFPESSKTSDETRRTPALIRQPVRSVRGYQPFSRRPNNQVWLVPR